MKAVILVGGEGTRLRPLTYDLPKPMVPICGKPFMEWQLSLLRRYGVDEVVFSLGYKSDIFTNYFGEGEEFGLRLHYAVEKEPLGTAGAIKNAEEYLDGERFFVLNGDILADFHLSEMLKNHINSSALCSIALTPVEDPSAYGVVEFGEGERIVSFIEKPKKEDAPSNLINAGLYILEPRVLDRMEKGRKYSIEREIFPWVLQEGEMISGFRHGGYWMDIGYPYKYLTANQDMLLGKIEVDIGLKEGLYIAPDADISGKALLKSPLWIGSGVKIEDGCEIVGPAVIGPRCEIGSGTCLEGALLWEMTLVGKNCRLDNCIIGRRCRIGDETNVGKLAVLGSRSIVQSGSEI